MAIYKGILEPSDWRCKLSYPGLPGSNNATVNIYAGYCATPAFPTIQGDVLRREQASDCLHLVLGFSTLEEPDPDIVSRVTQVKIEKLNTDLNFSIVPLFSPWFASACSYEYLATHKSNDSLFLNILTLEILNPSINWKKEGF